MSKHQKACLVLASQFFKTRKCPLLMKRAAVLGIWITNLIFTTLAAAGDWVLVAQQAVVFLIVQKRESAGG